MAVQTWTLNQLLNLRRYQPEMVDQALEEMLKRRVDLGWSMVIGAYLDQEINIGKVAELLGTFTELDCIGLWARSKKWSYFLYR